MYTVENVPYFADDVRALHVRLGAGEIDNDAYHAGMNTLERRLSVLEEMAREEDYARAMDRAAVMGREI